MATGKNTVREYVVIDLETTGLDLQQDEIIEIAAVKIRRGLVVDQYSSLVRCERVLTPQITSLTGISDEMLQGQPRLSEVLPQLIEFCGEAELAAHNAEFDAGFLHRYWPDDRIWLDTLPLAQIAWPTLPSYALRNLSAMLDLQHEQAHRALDDALATAALLVAAEKELEKLPLRAKEEILQLAADDPSPLSMLLRRKCGQPGAAVAPGLEKEQGARGARQKDDEYRILMQEIRQYLGEESCYRERIEGFEERPQQLKMALAVAESLNQKGFLLAEAGTGTGKSLAYLLPSALFALGSGKPVMISTHTRNLQEQLLNKDIPMLKRLLGRDVSAVVVKGRSNYLCRRLYQYMLRNPVDQLRYFLMRVASWRSRSMSGDGGELTLTSFDRWKWQRICASRENCAPFCPYARSNSCIVQRVRAAASHSDIIIVNHSLLVANAAIEQGFLPQVGQLIVDEAQHLEHAAEDQLTTGVDFNEILHLLGRLTRREKGRAAGALQTLRRYAALRKPEAMAELALRTIDEAETDSDMVIRSAERFFDLLGSSFGGQLERAAFFPHKVRILPQHRQGEQWQALQQQGGELSAALSRLARDCFRLLDQMVDKNDGEEQEKPAGSEELFGAGSLARELAETLTACLADADEDHVVWAEFPDPKKRPVLLLAPVELGDLLNTALYQRLDALVMTSATLAAGRDFSYFKRRLGLDLLPEPPTELVLPSPFFYRDQALFTIVNDLPDWSRCSEVAAVEAIGDALCKLLLASRGRAIVLFTSHHQLKAVFERIRRPLQEQGILLLAHGVSGEPNSLLARLKREERCCILGANSFWEGVDVIGSALSLVVVVRLPFWPPNDPLTATRMERIEAEGRSSFSDLSLPQALIRFKQGFGRLIRSDRDQGVFCVLDRRIIEKGYGSRFIRCLPDMQRYVGSSQEMAERIHAWLD